jgi:translation elongation factor EF-1alpha
VYVQLAKTLGVVKLIVVVNKLDDHSVAEDGKWSQTRYGMVWEHGAFAAAAGVKHLNDPAGA